MYNKITGRNVCFVPAAVDGTLQYGGTGATTWDTTGTLFSTSVTLANAALSALSSAGYNPIFKGVLWSQGECDAIAINAATETQAQYKSAFQTMIANYRAQFGADMPFYISRTGMDNTGSDVGYAAIRQAQEAVADGDVNTFIVFRGALDYTTLHYQVQGQYNTMGYEMARNVIATELGKMGANAISTGYRHLKTTLKKSNFVHEETIDIAGISLWQTIMTITPQTVTNIYLHGKIKAEILAATGGVGMGSRKSEWDIQISNGAPTVSIPTGWPADLTTGNAVPSFRIVTSGNNIQLQVQSSNGLNAFESGFAAITAYLPNAAAYAQPFEWYVG
jgi:hypothetical protein